MAQESLTAREIVQQSRSNLAFAFACLPRQKREDMTIFYAFCRIVDDIADDPAPAKAEKQRGLDHWKGIASGEHAAATPVEREIQDLLERYPIPRQHLQEIILGVEMDLTINRYDTYEQLEQYCYRVASAVGLVSIEIFGYQAESTPTYAVELGHALQITNIMRDVGEDLREDDRIYLPREDLDRFGVSETDLREGRHTEAFRQLMDDQAARAESRYAKAQENLDPQDRANLRASELMRAVYHALLQKMKQDRYQVLTQRYRLSSLQKLALLSRTLLWG